MAADKRGIQPGQAGKISYRSISTKGQASGQVLAADGQGGTEAVSPGSLVGATQLDELADVGSAPETDGFVLAANGTQYDGKTPDDANLVDKTTAQSISGQKTFTSPVKTDFIEPETVGELTILSRLVVTEAVANNQVPTLGQVQALANRVITVGHPALPQTPDFTSLEAAIDALTTSGGGTIRILDSEVYIARNIDGVIRDLRNIKIVGQPGALPTKMPTVKLVMDVDATEDQGSSSAVPLPEETTAWYVEGCRIPILGIQAQPTSATDIDFSIILDECAITLDDPDSESAGAGTDEGCIELKDLETATITVRNCYVEAAFRAVATKFICRTEGSVTKMWHTDLRPNDANTDLVPAVINNIQQVGASVDVDFYFDKTLTVKTGTFGFVDPLQIDFGRKLSPVDHTIFNSRLLIGMDSGGTVDPEKIFILAGMSMTAFEFAPEDTTGLPELAIRLRVPTGGITIDILSTGADGLDIGSETSNTWYHTYLIGDSRDIESIAGILSLSLLKPFMPVGYDVFRRIGSVRNNAAGNFVTAFAESGRVTYANDENTGITPGPTTVPTATADAYDFSVLVPPTALNMELDTFFAVADGTGVQELFIAHPDIISVGASSGGWRIARIAGAAGFGREAQSSTRDLIDVDSSGIAHMYTTGTLTNVSVRFAVRGYTERL